MSYGVVVIVYEGKRGVRFCWAAATTHASKNRWLGSVSGWLTWKWWAAEVVVFPYAVGSFSFSVVGLWEEAWPGQGGMYMHGVVLADFGQSGLSSWRVRCICDPVDNTVQ